MAQVDTYFSIAVKKYWLGIGGPFWLNRYEVGSVIGEVEAKTVAASGIAEALVAYERALHTTSVYFDSVLISTGEADTDPYDPTSFVSIPFGLFGERAIGSDKVDLNGVYKVRRSTEFGRPGKISYRGVLIESDVSAAAQGFWDLQAGSTLLPGGAAWVSAYAEIADWFGASDYRFAMFPNAGEEPNALNIPRWVIGFSPLGAGFNKFNHRYFDHTP